MIYMSNNGIEGKVHRAVEAALEKKAENLMVLEVGGLTSIADYFILCTVSSERQGGAVADAIEESLREQFRSKPIFIEGKSSGRWVLLDYGDFIAHIFLDETRKFYSLERLWGDAPDVTTRFVEEVQVGGDSER
jgi:ribosome-associated protein